MQGVLARDEWARVNPQKGEYVQVNCLGVNWRGVDSSIIGKTVRVHFIAVNICPCMYDIASRKWEVHLKYMKLQTKQKCLSRRSNHIVMK